MITLNGPICKDAIAVRPWYDDEFMPVAFPTTAKEELLACRKTAWLSCHLNFMSPVYDISGPDAVKLLNYVCVNRDFAKLKIGKSRHALLCNEKGQMLADGVLMRIEENVYRSYWLAPVLSYYVDTLGMDVTGRWVKDEYFLQIDGPKSLEIMEKACGEDLHDLKFAQNKNVRIADTDVTIHRLGMSGCLAYELHGDRKNTEAVYGAVVEAGEEYGIKRLATLNYCRNHTQAGYPNQWIQFWYPTISSGDKLAEYMKTGDYLKYYPIAKGRSYPFFGSASDDIENGFVTPFDVDWDYLINYDHEFIGKDALQEIKKNPPRKVVTLEWNAEDVGKVFASQFMGQEIEPCDEIVSNGDGGDAPFVISKVMLGDEMVGVAAGRTRDYYHRRMISLAYIRRDLAADGTELDVIWGTDPKTAMKIRTKVAAFPYYNEEYRNETFDVENIPHPIFD